MLLESNRIVMIDDDKDELQKLSKFFHDKGIGCRTFQYDALFDTPLNNVRMLFMDINLNNANEGDDKKRNATLRDALNLYLDKNNGPYVLVFWTSNKEWKDSFLEFMKRDEKDLPVSPFFITTMAKDELTKDKLKDKLDEIFDETSVRVLFEYEEAMAKSISDATNRIINTIPKDQKWGETIEFENNCKSVFASIAAKFAGKEFAKQDPDKAIKEALIPLYSHAFLNDKSELWKNCLRDKFGEKNDFPQSYNVAQLNSIFLIDDNVNNISPELRGAVCKINEPDWFIKMIYQSANGDAIDFNTWAQNTLPLKDQSNWQYVSMVSVEFSAACDCSQQKDRTYKYLLGLMIQADKDVAKDKLKESVLKLDFPIELENKSYKFYFNMNYTFTINRRFSSTMGNPICLFKKELMDMIGNRYANHVSRIGITGF